jgi:ADP-ribose pyrophosphatase
VAESSAHPSRRQGEPRPLGKGRWLRLEEVDYTGHDGQLRMWESVAREGTVGAVVMVAVLKPSGRLVLSRQYRPPVDQVVLEFPAGLVDAGETPEQTAMRELREETGFSGDVTQVLPLSYSSAGMSNEAVWLVTLDIDEDLPANRTPEPQPEDGEDIEVVLLPLEELASCLQTPEGGGGLDSKVVAFALGANLAVK